MVSYFPNIFTIFILISSTVQAQLLAVETTAKLPLAKHGACAFYDGNDSIYILGGYSIDTPLSADIYKFSISSDEIVLVGELPVPVFEMSASMDSSGNIYTHGGMIEFVHDNGTIDYASLDEIYRFDPSANTTTLVAHLPGLNHETVSIPGERDTAYILAGYHDRDAITLFNMTDFKVTHVASLPKPYCFMTAMSDGKGSAFVFGNEDDHISPTYSVAKVNMLTQEVTYGPPTFPRLIGMPAAVWDGNAGYIIGGYGNATGGYATNTIIQFDPVTMDSRVVTVANFATDGNPDMFFGWTIAVYVEGLNRIYLFGD